jgi:hypothetical protein
VWFDVLLGWAVLYERVSVWRMGLLVGLAVYWVVQFTVVWRCGGRGCLRRLLAVEFVGWFVRVSWKAVGGAHLFIVQNIIIFCTPGIIVRYSGPLSVGLRSSHGWRNPGGVLWRR